MAASGSNKSEQIPSDNEDIASGPPPAPPYLIHRSNKGLKLIQGAPPCNDMMIVAKTLDRNHRVESVCCSEDGKLIAWCDNSHIRCMKLESKEMVFDRVNDVKSNFIYTSPKGTKLVTYSTMSGGENLHFWDIPTQSLLSSMSFKRAYQWQPNFSMNEDLCVQHVNNDLLFYTNGKFDKPSKRMTTLKVADFSLSTNSSPSASNQHLIDKRRKLKNHYIAVYSQGAKAQPSFVRIYKYPNLDECIANKSFFNADRVKFNWSPSGKSMLLLCQADVDQSGKSYYGEQSLHFLNVKGESYLIKLSKEGPISHLEWFPSCEKDLFLCTYGFTPAQTTLFNQKCEMMFDFGEPSPFNETSFSPYGNLVALYGFGNLSGQISVWNFEKKRMLFSLKVPETTGFQWCADGLHFITTTTTPRLRVGNGFRLWHYTGSLIHEQIGHDSEDPFELYDLIWQPCPLKYRRPKCDAKPSQYKDLLSQSNLQKYQKSAGKYIPPSLRNNPNATTSALGDPAIGIGAGGRRIVGLESLSINNKSKPKRRKPKQQQASVSGNDPKKVSDKKPNTVLETKT